MKEKDDPRPIRELEPPPTAPRPVEEEPTILARWLHRALEQGPLFWVALAGLAVVLAGISVVTSSLMAAKSVTGQAWIDLVPAKSAEDQLKVADANPRTPVADWARLQAAYEEYRVGLEDLTSPGRRESAGPRLKRALDLFAQVAREAPHDSTQARGAAFAVARVLEARNELPEAIKQYRLVAETWKDAPEARQATTLARTLEDPDTVQFYKELYTAKAGATDATPANPLSDIAPPPLPTPPGGKPADLLVPGTSAAGKSFLPSIGPAGIDPPPATATPAPGATAPLPDKPLEAPQVAPTTPPAIPPTIPPK